MADFNDPFEKYLRQMAEARKKYHAKEVFDWKLDRDNITGALEQMRNVHDKLRSGILSGFHMLEEETSQLNDTLQDLANDGLSEVEKRIVRIRKASKGLRQNANAMNRLGHGAVAADLLTQADRLDILGDQARARDLEEKVRQIHKDALQPIDDMRDKFHTTWQTVKYMTTSLVGFRTALFLAGTAFTKTMLDAFNSLRDRGATLGGSFRGATGGLRESINQLFQGRFMGIGSATSTRTGLASGLGFSPTQGLVNVAARLQNTFSMGVEESTQLAEQMYRMSGFSEAYVDNMLSAAKGVEAITQIPAGDVIREMAGDANLFAQYMGKAPAQIAAAVVRAKQLSVSLQSADQFANRLTDDFESSLQLQAELQTLFPNFDLSEIQFASQYGSPDQVAALLSQQIQGLGISNISQLPRSIRNKLASSLGMSDADLQRALQGRYGGITDSQIQAGASGESTTENIIYSLSNMVRSMDAVSTALGILGGAALFAAGGLLGKRGLGGIAGAAGSLSGKFGGMFRGGSSMLARNIPIVGGLTSLGIDMLSGQGFGRSFAGATGAALGGTAGVVGGGGIGSIALGAAGAYGGHAAGTGLYDAITGETLPPWTQSVDGWMDRMMERWVADADRMSASTTDGDTVNKQLDRLIALMQKSEKVDIHMDGRKVGEGVRTAMERRY